MICNLFLHHFVPFFSSARVPEGVVLIRAVSPASPQGSVSQTHIHKNYPPYIYFTRTHTHKYTRAHFYLAAILTPHP